MPKLSIITVNLNDKTGLEKTIISVADQNFHDYEFIVIDGDSTDGSKEIIEKYNSRITYWISEKDYGIYQAMNKGIAKANGEYFLFLNSGDYLFNDKALSKDLFTSNADIIIGSIQVELNKINSKKIYSVTSSINSFFFSRTGFIPHQSTFIRKNLFLKYGLYDESFTMAGDYEFFMRTILINKVNYKTEPAIIAVYNDLGISSNPKFKLIHRNEIIRMLKHHSNFPASSIMVSIFLLREIFRDPIRNIAVKLRILHIYHAISSMANKSKR